MLTDPERVDPHPIRELDLFQQLSDAIRRIPALPDEAVNPEFHPRLAHPNPAIAARASLIARSRLFGRFNPSARMNVTSVIPMNPNTILRYDSW